MKSETTEKYIDRLLKQATEAIFRSSGQHLEISAVSAISIPKPEFGDYSSNIAMVLAKQVKKNPKQLAEEIIAQLKPLDTQRKFSDVKAVGGFINFTLAVDSLAENLRSIIDQRDLYGCSVDGGDKTVVFEYSSPNTNKPLHIGHTRNDVYGAACINLLKAQGYKVVSCEIINDRGIHIMKSMLMYQKFGAGKTPESEKVKPDHFVGKFYQMFAEQSSESPAKEKLLLDEAQALLLKWEAGDGEVRKLWQTMNNWWYAGVKQTYEKEGSYFDEVDYESDIYDKGRDLVLAGVKEGIFHKSPQDQSVYFAYDENGKQDQKFLLRADGTTIYITQDMYLWHYRNEKHHPNLALVTTAGEQAYHFKVLKKIFEAQKYPWAENFKHLPYEHVFLGKDKMSSRGGNTITADDLVESVKARIKEVMLNTERIKASAQDDKLVESIAFGAIKYGYLKYEPNTRIYFNLDETISVEGNTGPYIQYAHARICSMLKNAGDLKQSVEAETFKPQEENLMRKLLHYGELVEFSAREYKPNILCNYLFELAQTFNSFYQEVPVLKEQDEQLRSFRLNLITATAQVIKNGLYLLGIKAPEEM